MAVYRCKEPFTYTDADGTPILVGIGDIRVSGDPEFVKRAVYFEQIVTAEDATAEPGALRSLTRRRGRPPKNPQPEPAPPAAPEPEPAQPETPEEA